MIGPRHRRPLLLAGLLPAVLALLFAAKVALMLAHDGGGRDRFEDGDHVAAAGEFAANQWLNVLEPWIAHFDEGAARHAAGDLDAAVDAYREALAAVPEAEECLVRINLALAYEALGDAAVRKQAPDAAVGHWTAAIAVLTDGGCTEEDRVAPDPEERRDAREDRGEDEAAEERVDDRTLAERAADARATDRRLRDKLRERAPEEQREEQDPQEEQLEQNNEQAEEERQEIREDVELRDREEHPTW